MYKIALFLFEVILMGLCVRFKWISLCIWLLSVLIFQMGESGGPLTIYIENIDMYPSGYCIRWTRLSLLERFIFKKYLPEKTGMQSLGIPKELYYSDIIKIILWVFYTLVLIIGYFVSGRFLISPGVCYLIICFVVTFISSNTIIIKSFINYYKTINKNNLKYLFFNNNRPRHKMIGEGRIRSLLTKRRKKYAIVVMQENNEVLLHVLVPNNVSDYNKTVKIFEICGVKYASYTDEWNA